MLNTDTTKSAVVSPVTSPFDCCNRLLCRITDKLAAAMQAPVQNDAARVVSGSKKYDHIVNTNSKRSSLVAHQEHD